MTNRYEKLAAEWLASTGAVAEMGAWRLEQSLSELLETVAAPAPKLPTVTCTCPRTAGGLYGGGHNAYCAVWRAPSESNGTEEK